MTDINTGEKSPLDFVVDYVYIESDQIREPMNIASLVTEINIYEHIDKSYLTGSILISDNNDIYNDINFQGVEKIRLRVTTDVTANSNPKMSIEKLFVVTEVAHGVKSSDYNETFLLTLIEESAYRSRLTRVSKSYTGNHRSIIQKILKDNLDKRVKILSLAENGEDRPMKVVIPNLPPLEAANWIKERSSNQFGMPFFLYACLADESLRYVDLETILTNTPINAERDYVYSQTFGGTMDEFDVIAQSYIIQGYRTSKKEFQLELSRLGLAGSTYNFIDTTIGNNEVSSFDITKVFSGMKDRQALKPNQNNEIYDSKTVLENNKKVHEFDTKEISQIVTSNTYQDRSYNYYEAGNVNGHMLKATSKAMRHYLHKTSVDINVPGRNFFYADQNKSIGNIIKLSFKNTREENFADEHRDNKRSGEFMIYAARHQFSGDKYTVTLTCAKLANERGALA